MLKKSNKIHSLTEYHHNAPSHHVNSAATKHTRKPKNCCKKVTCQNFYDDPDLLAWFSFYIKCQA